MEAVKLQKEFHDMLDGPPELIYHAQTEANSAIDGNP